MKIVVRYVIMMLAIWLAVFIIMLGRPDWHRWLVLICIIVIMRMNDELRLVK